MKEKMKPLEELQKSLFQEIKNRIKQTDETVPYQWLDYMYYSRVSWSFWNDDNVVKTEDEKQYKIYCRKKLGSEKEEVMLDLNELETELGTEFLELEVLDISPDQNILAYSIDIEGDEFYDLYFKDLTTGKLLKQRIDREDRMDTSFEFGSDSKSIIFAVCDDAHRAHKVYRTTIDVTAQVDSRSDCEKISLDEDCEMIYEECDEKFFVSVSKPNTDKYIFVESSSNITTEWYYIRSDELASGQLKLFANKKRKEGVEFYVDHQDGYFYIWHNDGNFVNFVLCKTPENNPDFDTAQCAIPYDEHFFTEDVICFANHIAIFGRRGGVPKLVIMDPHGVKPEREVVFPEPSYDLESSDNFNFNTNIIRIVYSSFVTPETTFDYNMDTNEFTTLKQEEVLGGYDKTQYKQEKIMIPSRDGIQIPVSLVYKKQEGGSIVMDGNNPCLLYGYGAYGYSIDAYFSHSLISLLDRGFVYASVAVRGGAECGRSHYLSGKLLNKRNSFNDFIDAAEHLIKTGWTKPDKLVCKGGSAGGLLIGSTIAMRPELFCAAVLEVPFVDVMNSMLDTSIPLTETEKDEWGNPELAHFFDYMISYSPYDNIDKEENVDKAFPSILVDHAFHDSRVQYWEGLKFVAKVRHFMTNKRKEASLVLCKTNMQQGHGGGTQRYEQYKETAFRYAFIINQVQPEEKK